jgi:hypothetical protein
MSNNKNGNGKKEQTELGVQEPQSEFDRWLNDTGPFVKLPPTDGGSIVVQFFNDKTKRELIDRTFEDPQTGQKKITRRAKYKVLMPQYADQGEKDLEVPKTLAQKIEMNIIRGHCLLEIVRRGMGTNTRYEAIAAD